MSNWTLLGGGADCKSLTTNLSASNGMQLTAVGSANTKGAWEEVIASTADTVSALIFSFACSGIDYLFDVGIGAAGSEVVVAENLYSGNGSSMRLYQQYFLPIRIPAGSRISIRYQASGTLAPLVSVLSLRGAGMESLSASRVVAYGADTSDSGGTSVDPGTSANTKGSWTQIAASTSRDANGFILAFGGLADISRSTCWWLVDVAIGAAGSENIIIENLSLACRAEHDTVLPQITPLFPIPIPAGSRIAVRAQCDITTAGDRLFDAFLYAME